MLGTQLNPQSSQPHLRETSRADIYDKGASPLALNPITLNPKPYILNPKPEILNPKP